MIEKIDTIYGTFNREQLKQLKGYIEETVQQMDIIRVTNQTINDIATIANNNLNIPKKVIKRLAKAQMKQSFQDEAAEFKEVEALHETLNEIQ